MSDYKQTHIRDLLLEEYGHVTLSFVDEVMEAAHDCKHPYEHQYHSEEENLQRCALCKKIVDNFEKLSE
jgi:hypothetical protein